MIGNENDLDVAYLRSISPIGSIRQKLEELQQTQESEERSRSSSFGGGGGGGGGGGSSMEVSFKIGLFGTCGTTPYYYQPDRFLRSFSISLIYGFAYKYFLTFPFYFVQVVLWLSKHSNAARKHVHLAEIWERRTSTSHATSRPEGTDVISKL